MAAISDILKKVTDLKLSDPDEERPYDHLYKAAALCEEAIQETRKGDMDVQLLHVLMARRGLILLETDLLADGQACLEEALPWLEANLTPSAECSSGKADQDDESVGPALILECYNGMGALQSGRSDFDAALAWLEKAEALYESIVKHNPLSKAEKNVEAQYTSTLFYLAQVYAHADRKDKSAEYCAATLRRQLEGGDYRLNEWVQNCMQLAGYFTSSNAFAIGQYYVMAAEQVAKLSGNKQKVLETMTKDIGQSNQEASVMNSNILDADVAANMELAWAKLSLQRLVASYDRKIAREDRRGRPAADPEGSSELPLFPSPEAFPVSLKFAALDLPPLDTLPWGDMAYVSTFEEARDVFNAGMLRYKAALEHYMLDGCVTEHCNIVMEISNMYRCLAAFEPGIHRQRLMQRQRASRLEALHGVLNKEHFLGLVRSIALELGNICREVSELEEAEGRPMAKAASARRDAIRYYREFVDSFRTPQGPGGTLPGSSSNAAGGGKSDRVEDALSERYLMQASFALGRLLSRASDMDSMVQASEQLRWTADYVSRFDLSDFKREAIMALEMSILIMEKVELNKKVAALPSSGSGKSL